MKRILPALILVLFTPLLTLHAQQQRFSTWKAELPGGEYIVKLDRIASISLHDYTVDGTLAVSEMTITTDTSVTARFYYLEPKQLSGVGGAGDGAMRTIQDKATETMRRLNQDAAETMMNEVIKTYPLTTHAHMVEYRMTSRDSLKAAYDSATKAWLTLRNGTFKEEE
ncbi:MAG: hypothetical protein AAGK14_09470 [Verrucomicrobiota bacterium]